MGAIKSFSGSFQCDGCKLGYIGTGDSCSDENECTRRVCDEFENTDCFNTKVWFANIGKSHCTTMTSSKQVTLRREFLTSWPPCRSGTHPHLVVS